MAPRLQTAGDWRRKRRQAQQRWRAAGQRHAKAPGGQRQRQQRGSTYPNSQRLVSVFRETVKTLCTRQSIWQKACLQNHQQEVAAAVQQNGAQKPLGFFSGPPKEQGWKENRQLQDVERSQVSQSKQQRCKPQSGVSKVCFSWPGFIQTRLEIAPIEVLFAQCHHQVLVHHPLWKPARKSKAKFPWNGGARNK